MSIEIETIYKCTIFYEFSGEHDGTEPFEKVDKFIKALSHKEPTVDFQTTGGVCWTAFVIITSDSHKSTLKCAKKIHNYIKKFKNHEFF